MLAELERLGTEQNRKVYRRRGSGEDVFGVSSETRIEREIHGAPNRVRHAMNNAVIAIEICKPGLTEEATAAAGRSGRVEVDHGETSCKTPEAVPCIERALARKARTAGGR